MVPRGNQYAGYLPNAARASPILVPSLYTEDVYTSANIERELNGKRMSIFSNGGCGKSKVIVLLTEVLNL